MDWNYLNTWPNTNLPTSPLCSTGTEQMSLGHRSQRSQSRHSQLICSSDSSAGGNTCLQLPSLRPWWPIMVALCPEIMNAVQTASEKTETQMPEQGAVGGLPCWVMGQALKQMGVRAQWTAQLRLSALQPLSGPWPQISFWLFAEQLFLVCKMRCMGAREGTAWKLV